MAGKDDRSGVTTRTKIKAKPPAKSRARGVTKTEKAASCDAHRLKIIEGVLADYEKGSVSLRTVCKKHGISPAEWWRWTEASEELRGRYAQARARAEDADFDVLSDLSDEAPPTTAMGACDSAWVTWQKNRIDVRKWMLAKRQPNKYGDRQQIDHNVTDSMAEVLMGARKRSGIEKP